MSFESMTGENGIVLVILSGTTYTEIVGLTEVDVDEGREYYPDTIQGNTSKSAKPGLPDFSATLAGLVDATDDLIYSIADGVARTATIKLDRSAATTASHQWRGKVFFDIKTKAPVEGLISVEVACRAQAPGVQKFFADV